MSAVPSSVVSMCNTEQFGERLFSSKKSEYSDDIANLEDLDSPDTLVRDRFEIWAHSCRPTDFSIVIKKNTKQDMEVFAQHSGHHFLSEYGNKILVGGKPVSLSSAHKDYDLLSQTSEAMGDFLKDPSKSQCTGFVIPGEEMGMGYSAQIEYVQKLLCDPQY